MGTPASYTVYCILPLVSCHVHCCFVSRALLLHILYATYVLPHMYTMGTTASHFVCCVLPHVLYHCYPALYQGHCCLIYFTQRIYCCVSIPQTLLFVPRALLLCILYAVYLHILCVMGTATLSQRHCCFI